MTCDIYLKDRIKEKLNSLKESGFDITDLENEFNGTNENDYKNFLEKLESLK